MWRLIFFVPSWFLFFLFIRIPLIILGYITVPLALLFQAYRLEKSKYNGQFIYVFTWDWMLPWQNQENGFYYNGYFDHGFILTSLRWTLIRNPVNGLREVKYLSCLIDPKRVRFMGTFGDSDQKYLPKEEVMKYDTKVPHWFLCWHGLYSCIYWQVNIFGLRRLWIGWKIRPNDVYGVSAYRAYGAGFATQTFKRVKV
jgi:hypothetical protein